jgi:hypothetical protein
MAERVQVQGLGGAVPGISPTIQRGGQYAVQVQQAGRNKLMDLADALGQVNPLLQQYGQLQQVQEKIGVERAEALEEQQVQAELKKLSGKDIDGFHPLAVYNRERGYRDALLKRHINNKMVPELNLKAADLLNIEKYGTQEEVLAGIDDTLNTAWQGLVTDVGDNVANTTAAKALWNAVTPQFKNKIVLQHQEAKDKFLVKEKVNEGQLELDALYSTGDEVVSSEIEAFVNKYDDELLKTNPRLTAPERSALLVDMMKTRLQTLQAKRQFQKASRLEAILDGVSVGKDRQPIFRSGVARDALNPIRKEIRNKIASLATENKTQSVTEFKGLLFQAYGRLPARMTKDKFFKRDADGNFTNNTLTSIRVLSDNMRYMDPTLTDERILEMLETRVFDQEVSPSAAFERMLRELSYNDPDRAPEIFNKSVIGVKTALAEAKTFVGAQPNLSSPVAREKLVQQYIDDWDRGSSDGEEEYTFDDYLNTNGIDSDSWAEGREASDRLNAALPITKLEEFKKLETNLNTNLKAAALSIDEDILKDDTLPPEFLENYQQTSFPILKKQIRENGAEIMLDDSLSSDKKFEKIRAMIKETVQNDAAIFKVIANISRERVEDIKKPPSEVTLEDFEKAVEAEREKEPGGLGKLFGITGEGSKYRSTIIQNPSADFIAKDREEMLKDYDALKGLDEDKRLQIKNLLGSSLYDHGFTSYKKENGKLLQAAGLDYGDVIIFKDQDEMDDVVVDRWNRVMFKLERRMPLDEDDQEVFEEMQLFKVVTPEARDAMMERQSELMLERDSRSR